MNGLAWSLVMAALGLAMTGLAALWLRERQRSRRQDRLLGAADAKLEALQRQFERFVPADVVERLTDGSDTFAPERRQVTMLFADLRGFTAMCEGLDPAVTVSILNDYFRHMTLAINAHHGHVTEFVGDGLLALFGAMEPNPWQGRDAVLAALDMRVALARYNAQLQSKGLPQLRFGIGIHGGEVVAGVMGTPGLSKFSVTGDPINVASRIEGLTSKLQVDLLFSDQIRQQLDDSFELRAMPLAEVKGKSGLIQTWTVEPAAAQA